VHTPPPLQQQQHKKKHLNSSISFDRDSRGGGLLGRFFLALPFPFFFLTFVLSTLRIERVQQEKNDNTNKLKGNQRPQTGDQLLEIDHATRTRMGSSWDMQSTP
jgi:hypothetical protein